MAKSAPSSIDADEGPTNAVEAMVSDAIDSQRAIGVMPTPVDAAQFIQPIVERLENKPQPKATPSSGKKEGAVEKEYYRKGGTPGSFDDFEVKREAEGKPRIQTAKVMRDLGARLIAARLRQMRADPEWMNRIKTINPLAINGVLGDEKRREACSLMWALIKDSVRKFGPLDSTSAKPLWFT